MVLAARKKPVKRTHHVMWGTRCTHFLLREAGSLFLKLIILAVLLVGAGVFFMDKKIVDIPFAAEQVERQIAKRLTGAAVQVDRFEMVLGEGEVPSDVVLRDVTLIDDLGETLVRAPVIRTGFSMMEALNGKWRPKTFEVEGVSATFRRDRSGRVSMSLGSLGAGQSALFQGGATDIGALLAGGQAGNGGGIFEDLSEITFSQMDLRYEDEPTGQIWQSTDAIVQLTRTEEGLSGVVRAHLSDGLREPTQVFARFEQSEITGDSRLLAEFENAAPVDIANQVRALDLLRLLDAPTSGNLSATIRADGSLGEMAGVLELGSGVLRPAEGAEIDFDHAKSYFSYNPARQVFSVDQFNLETSVGRLSATGRSQISFDDAGQRVTSLVSQLEFRDIELLQGAMLPEAVEFEGGRVGLRLTLDPFRVDLGELTLLEDKLRLSATGSAELDGRNWKTALDIEAVGLDRNHVLGAWPEQVRPNIRKWVANHVTGGQIKQAHASLRLGDGPLRLATRFEFEEATSYILRSMPPIVNGRGIGELTQDSLRISLLDGKTTSTQGGQITLGESEFLIADIRAKPATGIANITAAGDIPALLSLVDHKPLAFISRLNRTPDLAEGNATVQAALSFPFKKDLRPVDVTARVTADLSDVVTDTIVPGRQVESDALRLTASNEALRVAGIADVSGVPFDFEWARDLGEGAGPGSVVGTFPLSTASMQTFGVRLPEGSVSGQAEGRLELMLRPDGPPDFVLSAGLASSRIAIPALGWMKPTGRAGDLRLTGRLGAPVDVQSVRLEAAGLLAEGDLTLGNAGLEEARFSRLRVGGWLDAPVTLRPRTNGRGSLAINGGTVDLRNLEPGGGSGAYQIAFNPDRLVVSDTIQLHRVRGNLDTEGGIHGRLTGLINGGAPIDGVLQRDKRIFLTSNSGGEALRDAGVYRSASGGVLRIALRPGEGRGVYDGTLDLRNTRVQNAPALAELLNVASIVGIPDTLAGPGIGFAQVDGFFRLTPDRITVWDAKAVAPSLGVTLNGTYAPATQALDMEGVVSPVYFVNGIFEKVPGLGRILGGRDGEGLLGFNYAMRGPAASPQVTVNPLSLFTPGAFRQIFQRDPGFTPEISRSN